ncbi:MAG: antibiotic biosynthesis monooxygenase [Bacteroidota bacterium]
MILRIWHGYTSKANASTYEKLLKTEVIPAIEQKQIAGYRKFQLLRRELDKETEFTTIMWFDQIESVIDFVGEDYESVYVPEKAKAVLSRYDTRAAHSELIVTFDIHPKA